jgi:hypothetical protein
MYRRTVFALDAANMIDGNGNNNSPNQAHEAHVSECFGRHAEVHSHRDAGSAFYTVFGGREIVDNPDMVAAEV